MFFTLMLFLLVVPRLHWIPLSTTRAIIVYSYHLFQPQRQTSWSLDAHSTIYQRDLGEDQTPPPLEACLYHQCLSSSSIPTTKADVKESRRPNDPIQTYIPMNRNSQGDINEHGSTRAKHRQRPQYKEDEVEPSGRQEYRDKTHGTFVTPTG
jgi:hypothetical protein